MGRQINKLWYSIRMKVKKQLDKEAAARVDAFFARSLSYPYIRKQVKKALSKDKKK